MGPLPEDGGLFFALRLRFIDWSYPPRSLGMCGLIRLFVYKQGVGDVIDVTRQQLKQTRRRLHEEGWVLYHSEIL